MGLILATFLFIPVQVMSLPASPEEMGVIRQASLQSEVPSNPYKFPEFEDVQILSDLFDTRFISFLSFTPLIC